MKLHARWSEKGEYEAGLHHLLVFVAGKWRPQNVVCRQARSLKRDEINRIQHSIWLNTGKRAYEKDIQIILAEEEAS